MNEPISQDQEICKALSNLKITIFNTLMNDEMWNKVAHDILKTPSLNFNLNQENNTDIVSMIKLLPSYEKLLTSFKEKIQQAIDSCQPKDYEDLLISLLHQCERDKGSLDEYPGPLLPSTSSSSKGFPVLFNKPTRESIELQDNLQDISCNNNGYFLNDVNLLKSFHRCSSCSSTSSVCLSSHSSSSSTGHSSLTLCAISSPKLSTSSSTSPQKRKQKKKVKCRVMQSTEKKLNRFSNENCLMHSNTEEFQRSTSPSNMHNSVYSFSDADSSISGCFNNVGLTVMNQDQLISLASALDSRSSRLDCRQKALKQLVHLPIIDVQACEVWTYLNVNASSSPSSSLISSVKNINSTHNSLATSNSIGSNVGLLDNRMPSKVSLSSKLKNYNIAHRFRSPEGNHLVRGQTSDNIENIHRKPIHPTSNNDNRLRMITAGGLRSGLADALNDEDDVLWSLSLRYISKGLSTTPSNIRETYSLLVEYLQLQFTKNAHHYPLLADGVDFHSNRNNRVLRAVSFDIIYYQY
ncbi:unnamed protein product [Heterobilharzia americana]|nr:unnamed protein product [Heterobilharzia americana]